MPRKRMINPGFWRDEKIAACTCPERLMFIGLWNFAEDHGVGRANPKLIRADIFPYDSMRDADVEKGLAHLQQLGLIELYKSDGQMYYYLPNFKKHQTINKPTPPTMPLPKGCGSSGGVRPPNTTEEKRIEKKKTEDNPPKGGDGGRDVLLETPEWRAFVEMRRSMGKPLMERAQKMALTKLQKLAPQDIEGQKRILDQSVYHCWQGLYPLNTQRPTGRSGPNVQPQPRHVPAEEDVLLNGPSVHRVGSHKSKT